MAGMNSEKFNVFMDELNALCKKHSVQLSVDAYEELLVYDLEQGNEPIHFPRTIDMTGGWQV